MEYFHVLFDRHEIMLTNGAPTESFFPGAYVLGDLDRGIQEELHAIFPHLEDDFVNFGPPARVSVRPRDAAVLQAVRAR